MDCGCDNGDERTGAAKRDRRRGLPEFRRCPLCGCLPKSSPSDISSTSHALTVPSSRGRPTARRRHFAIGCETCDYRLKRRAWFNFHWANLWPSGSKKILGVGTDGGAPEPRRLDVNGTQGVQQSESVVVVAEMEIGYDDRLLPSIHTSNYVTPSSAPNHANR